MFSPRHCGPTLPDQIDGLPGYYYPPEVPATPLSPSLRQAAIDSFFAAIPADVRHGGNGAFYSPTFDYIQMPKRSSFISMDHYASVRVHETGHWTGHGDRLARTFGKRFGDKAYAFEELVALSGQSAPSATLQ